MALPTTFVIVSLLIAIFIQSTLSDQSVGTNFIYEQENHPYAAKTIQNEHGGDIYDCVNIYKQPSLNHPLLKNHKIQMSSSASFKSVSIFSDSSSSSNKTAMKSTGDNEHLKIKLRHIKCPRGTVPIRRIPKQKKDQVLGRGRGRPTFQTQPHSSDGTNVEPEETYFAGILTKDLPNKIYHGARATSALYKPKNVKPNQMSGVILSLQNPGNNVSDNRIEVGWMVNPEVYGDDNTRLYTRWTTDDEYGTGCYNLACPGFILVNSIPLDYVFNETDTATKHVHTVFEIGQDSITGNWWFLLGDDRVKVGYWPKEIVPKLVSGAQIVKMGGLVVSPPYEPKTPPMGSGNPYSGKNYDKTAYFSRIQFVDESNKVINGDDSFIDRAMTRCYLAGDNSYKDYAPKGFSFVIGYSFLYGGPGGDIAGEICFTPV